MKLTSAIFALAVLSTAFVLSEANPACGTPYQCNCKPGAYVVWSYDSNGCKSCSCKAGPDYVFSTTARGTTTQAYTTARRTTTQAYTTARRTTTQAYTTTRRTTTQVYTTAKPVTQTYTTRRTTTQAYTTRRQTTQTYTTQAYTTRRQTTQAYTTAKPVTQVYTTRAYTTQAYTTRRQTTQAYTTKAYTTQAYTTRRQTTQAYTTKAYTTQGYTTKAYTTQAYTTKAYTTQGYTTKAYTTQGYTTKAYTTQGYTTKAYTTTTTQGSYSTPSTYTAPYTTTTSSSTTTKDMSEVDIAILNFALNLEYLEAEYYCAAVGRTPSYEGDVGGTVTGGERVNFTTPEFRQYAEEIASDEEKHVVFLRRVLGSRAVDRPDINIAGGADGAFGQAAKAAGANANLNQATQDALGTFNPYTNELYFLHGAFIFEDVGVTAYKGAAPLLTNKDYLSAAAGILAVEAYHAGEVRTLLYGVRRTIAIAANAVNGSSALRVEDIVGAISGLRASLDGAGNGGNDQTIVDSSDNGNGSGSGSGDDGSNDTANIVPADDDALAFGRTPRQILNIVYGAQDATVGLFFPNGMNGDFSALL